MRPMLVAMRAIGTVATHSYLPLARVLMNSVARHHPDVARYVLLIDPIDGEDVRLPGCTVLGLSDILEDREELRRRMFLYDVVEFSCSLKPLLALWLVQHHEWVTFLDCDTKLFAALPDEILADVDAAPRLTAHRLTPPPLDGMYPDERYLQSYGMYNTGVFTVSARTRPFLQWWDSRLRRHGAIDVAGCQYLDQRITDLAAVYFGVDLVSHPGVNVGKWNLDERPLSGQDPVLVGDEALVLVHFSGVPTRSGSQLPAQLRMPDARARRSAATLAVFEGLCTEYATELREHGLGEQSSRYPGDDYPDGSRISLTARRRYRKRVIAAEQRGEVSPPVPRSELPGQRRLDFAQRSGVVEGLRSGLQIDAERLRRLGSSGIWRKMRRAD